MCLCKANDDIAFYRWIGAQIHRAQCGSSQVATRKTTECNIVRNIYLCENYVYFKFQGRLNDVDKTDAKTFRANNITFVCCYNDGV